MANIADVRTAFESVHAAIAQLDQSLAAESKRIKGTAFDEGREMTNAEVRRRKSISATRMKLADALKDLALETVDAAENADDLGHLIKEIQAVNQQLKDDLDHLKIMVEHAQTAAKVADGLVKATAKLVEFAT